MPVLVSLFVRRLQPGQTYDDFRRAWYPDEGFGVPARVLNGVRVDDPQEIFTVGFVDLGDADLSEVGARIAAQERVRHDRIEAVLESTPLRQMYTLVDDDDFTAAPKPFGRSPGFGLVR